ATPTSGHYAITKACLQAGKHVLVEKPIAVTPSEAHELVQLAKERGCCLQVGHSERFNPVMALMIHDLDLVLSFNPGPIEEVRAVGVTVLSTSLDIANARIQFQSGCVANLTSSRVSMKKMRRLRLFQQNNYVS